MTPDLSILNLIKLTYEGDELEMYLDAWEVYPTLKNHCAISRQQMEYLREQYVNEMKKQKVKL